VLGIQAKKLLDVGLKKTLPSRFLNFTKRKKEEGGEGMEFTIGLPPRNY